MKLISAFVYPTRIVQFPYFLNPKFTASSHLLLLHMPVCVGPGRKPQSPAFSCHGSYYFKQYYGCVGRIAYLAQGQSVSGIHTSNLMIMSQNFNTRPLHYPDGKLKEFSNFEENHGIISGCNFFKLMNGLYL